MGDLGCLGLEYPIGDFCCLIFCCFGDSRASCCLGERLFDRGVVGGRELRGVLLTLPIDFDDFFRGDGDGRSLSSSRLSARGEILSRGLGLIRGGDVGDLGDLTLSDLRERFILDGLMTCSLVIGDDKADVFNGDKEVDDMI